MASGAKALHERDGYHRDECGECDKEEGYRWPGACANGRRRSYRVGTEGELNMTNELLREGA
jgi:hypothetical protein